MRHTFDLETILFGILSGNSVITSSISGGIYLGSRPDNSRQEDLVINTINVTQEYLPQIATSNINIYVPDRVISINGVSQRVENRARLRLLTEATLHAIREFRISGLSVTVESQMTLQEAEISQHFTNIRIKWNIHN